MNIINNINKFWYHDGHLNEDQRDFLIELLAILKPLDCLEIGFATGRSTITILEACQPRKLLSIDVDLDYMAGARAHASLLQQEYPELTIIEGNSNSLLTTAFMQHEFLDGVDFAFIDGGHQYDVCLKDIENVYPRMSKSSIILIDDYESGPPNGCVLEGVNRAVNDFCKLHQINFKKWHKHGKGFAIIQTGLL